MMNVELKSQRVPSAPAADGGSLGFVILISAVAALGGLLFGFDTAVISGAIGFLESQFALDAAQKGFAASSALLGCAAGAAAAGVLADRFGRKRILIVSAVLFLISAVWSAIPRTVAEFNVARVIGGLGIGIASMLSPLYIAEVAPARIRGALVACNQMAIITGILMAYLTDWACAANVGNDVATSQAWRWMFASEALPACLFGAALLLVPESPRWLIKQGREAEGGAILARVSGAARAAAETQEIRETIAHEGASIFELLKPGLRVALLVGVMLAILQQITGINTVLYYAPEIFKQAGLATGDALLSSVYIGAINALFTVLAIALVDRIGRKPLLLFGSAGMGVSIAAVAWAFQTGASSRVVLVALLAYVASFALTLGPVVWIVMAEIFPTRIRGKAMSLATVTLWVSCYVVSQTFPMLIDLKGLPFTYAIYAAICFAAVVCVAAIVPETKGKTLEEIERRWMR